MLGLFNQFKYIPLKACPLVLELELVSNFTDCIITPGAVSFPASGDADSSKHTSGEFLMSIFFLQCDSLSHIILIFVNQVLSRDNQTLTQPLFVLFQNSLPAFITFEKNSGRLDVHKDFNRFYRPMRHMDYQLQGFL